MELKFNLSLLFSIILIIDKTSFLIGLSSGSSHQNAESLNISSTMGVDFKSHISGSQIHAE